MANTKSGTIAGAVEKVLKNPPAFILFKPMEIVVPINSEKKVVTKATKIVLWKLLMMGSLLQIFLYQSKPNPFQIRELLLVLKDKPTTAIIGKYRKTKTTKVMIKDKFIFLGINVNPLTYIALNRNQNN
jgi:hypothetical protein